VSEAQTAEVLGCSIGTVKAASSRAVARLRVLHAEEVTP
jgi:DNA-directed RNA polymerase specialized sigma24 family protein